MKVWIAVPVVALLLPTGTVWATPATLAEDTQTLRGADNASLGNSAALVASAAAATAAETLTVGSNPIPPVPAAPSTLENGVTTTQTRVETAGATLEKSPPADGNAEVTSAVTLPGGTTAAVAPQNLGLNGPKEAAAPLPPFGASDPVNPWQAASLVTVALAGLGLFGWTLVRFRKRSTHAASRTEKPMQIISTLPLSPKRQILLVRIRDQEIVLSSTEHGITMLTELNDRPATRPAFEARPLPPLPRPAEVVQGARESLARVAAPQPEPLVEKKAPVRKEDFLSKALNSIKEKKNDKEPHTPTLSQTHGSFPKYVANVFEQEAKRDLKEKNDEGNDDTVESVTRMIRERLKNIQPHSEG